MNDELYASAAALLGSIWRAMDAEFKASYRRTVWKIFEDRARVAANQNATLARFASQLCRALQSSLGRNEADRAAAQAVLASGQDRAILRILRDETPYVVMLLRVEAAERAELYREIEAATEEPNA